MMTAETAISGPPSVFHGKPERVESIKQFRLLLVLPPFESSVRGTI
jgi:hypothetical protein